MGAKIARLAALALAGACLAGTAAAQDAATGRYIEVDGQGEVTAAPDMATVSAGVEAQSATAHDAMAATSAAMEKVLAALRAAGIPERAIRTSRLAVFPVYDRARATPEPRKLIGYRATNQVDVKIDALGRIGALLDTLVTAGANRIQGVRFAIKDPKPLEDEARRKAIDDARRRATIYAASAGVRLGAVRRIEERGVGGAIVARAAALDVARSVPVAPGEQTIQVGVSVRFAIAE